MGDLKFQIEHYASEMWRRKWSVLLVGLLVGLLGTFFAATRPDTFTSRAAIEVDENALLNAVLPRGVPRTNTSAEIDSVRRGIYARPNLEQIVYETDLNLTLNDRRGMEALVENLEKKLELKRESTNFYTIEYTHNDPIVARDVTQAALDIFLERSTSGTGQNRSNQEDARNFLQSKLDNANVELSEVEATVAEYQREHGDAIRGTNAVQNELRSLREQIIDLNSNRDLLRGELANLQARLAATPAEIVVRRERVQQPLRQRRVQSQIAAENQRQLDYEIALERWQIENSQPIAQLPDREIFGPNPLIAELRTQAADRRSRINVVENQIARANEGIRRVEEIRSKQPEIVQQFSKLETKESKLLSEVASLENQLAVIQPSNVQGFRMKVVEPPLAPVTPAGPNRLLLFLGAFMLAGGSGLGLAFMRVQLSDNIPTIKHLKNSFDLPILGGVSLMEEKGAEAKKAAGNILFLALVAAAIVLFGYVTYRFHFELWRPDFTGLLAKVGLGPNVSS